MEQDKKPSVMGRPKIEFSWAEFDKLCNLHCTLVEIAGWFDCSEDTVERRVKETYGVTFADHYKTRAATGKISLRRKQMEVALNGNVGMLIWLGKQVLGQTEKSFHGFDGNNPPVLQIVSEIKEFE